MLYNNKAGDNSIIYDTLNAYIYSRELEMNTSSYEMNEYLNDNILFDEIEKVLSMLHRNKAVGLDQIQNEALKHKNIKLIIYNLFSFCFQNKVIPSVWQQAIISPIYKGQLKDPLKIL